MSNLAAGLRADFELNVTEADTASRWGSGLVPVYSTPALVGAMEKTAVLALEGHLPTGQTTVGGWIEVRHLAPTPVGMKVRVAAKLIEIEGRKLVFKIEAWDEIEKIGEASHERFMIDEARFMAKVQSKGK
ncbi:MAG: thioesterase [Chloroflexi bacterium HGW-Chloroflexi-6]|nr:MAG: thioesterase [Chloroflexi bacterium HGW-Chloroflexi-6]